MKRASYRDAVDFIALNDEPLDLDEENVSGYTTVVLVAALFGIDTERVARDVVRRRRVVHEEWAREERAEAKIS